MTSRETDSGLASGTTRRRRRRRRLSFNLFQLVQLPVNTPHHQHPTMSAAEPPVASSSKTPAEAPPRGPGPDAASFKRHPERAYTGPKEASLPKRLIEFKNPDHNPRIEPPLPRLARASGWAGWIVGTGESAEAKGRGEDSECEGCGSRRARRVSAPVLRLKFLRVMLTDTRRHGHLHGPLCRLWTAGARLLPSEWSRVDESKSESERSGLAWLRLRSLPT